MVLESVARVIRNERGQPEKLLIVNRDITERKKAQEALSRSEGSFRALVEGAPYGIYRATLTGQFHERHRVGMEAAERRADRRTVLGPPRGGQGWRSRLF